MSYTDSVTMTTALLTLRELSEAASRALEAAGVTPANRQAKAVPAPRMVRYYLASGLLDRPGSRGHELVFGRRHLLQLVAIKRLQAQGRSLDEIAGVMRSAGPGTLEALADLPPGAEPEGLGDVTEPSPGAASPAARRQGRFWATGPAPARAVASATQGRPTAVRAAPVEAFRLAPGLVLVLDGQPPADAPSSGFLAELQQAAAPLISLLTTNGLLPPAAPAGTPTAPRGPGTGPERTDRDG